MSMRPILIILLFVISFSLYSQDKKPKPKVALVLSGGTAKGLAHIGVLKVLEEQGIRPDIIIGTSMGSIVGGLYALGYSADEIEQISLKTDWFKYLSNDMDLRNLNIEEKDDYDEYVYNFPVEKRKPSLGKGIIYGHELELYLNRITFSANKYSNFDEFPIRFRAIATDVLHNEAYVFKDGSLALALRASMSIPSLFEPIRYKGRVLVDGGILDNFGVDIALAEDADIIIGSNVERISKSENDFDTYKNLFAQLMMLHSKQNYKLYKDSVDVLIEPPVIEMGTKFDKAQKIIDIGYETTLNHLGELKKIVHRVENADSINKQIIHEKYFPISQIAIRGINNLSYKNNIYNRLRKSIGLIASYPVIEKEITNLYRSGHFSYIKYYLEKIGDNEFKLLFDFAPKAKTNLQLGVHYSEQVDLGLIAGIESRNTLSPNTKLKIKARISKYPGVDQYFAKYFKTKKYGFGIKQFINYTLDKISIYEDQIRLTDYNRHSYDVGVKAIWITGQNSMLESGYKFQKRYFKSLFKTNYQNIRNAEVNRNTMFLSYYFNSLDDKYFSVKGLYLKTQIGYNFSTKINNKLSKEEKFVSGDYGKFDFNIAKYISLNNKWTVESKLYAEYNIIDDSSKFVLYDKILGGVYSDNNYQIAFWGMPNSYIISKNYTIASLGLRYKISDRIYLKSVINAGVINLDEYHLGGGLLVSFKLPIGPFSMGITKSLLYDSPQFHISMGSFR